MHHDFFQKFPDCSRPEAGTHFLAHILESPDHFCSAHPEYRLSPEQQQLAGIFLKNAVWEPMAYLTGMQEFFRTPFFLSPDVLILRPETELCGTYNPFLCQEEV